MIINPYLFAPANDLVNTVAPAITGIAVDEYILTCSTGTWTGTGSITYTYQWTRNGSNIGSATNSTYTLVTADVGQSILCVVTATNITGSASANSNTVTPISNAQYFINQAGITDSTQQSAINTLVTDLKGYNIWTKFKAIYPIVGGSASAHSVNLKTPGTFNLSFQLGWTHSATGMLPNGATFADTNLNNNTILSLNSVHISYYSRTNENVAVIEMGAGLGDGLFIEARTSGISYYRVHSNALLQHSDSDSRAFYVANRTASNVMNAWKNGTKLATSTGASTFKQNYNIYIGALNNGGTASFATNKQCAFASIGDGLTDTEAVNFYTAVQAYQTTLSRQV